MIVAGTVAVAYVGGVVGLHRLNVWRQRNAAAGFSTLRWLDWDTLLEGLLPPGHGHSDREVSPVEGGPTPTLLRSLPDANAKPRYDLLCALVTGHRIDEDAFSAAGFSGGEAHWLWSLSRFREEPDRVLDRLQATPPASAAEVYLREFLFLEKRVHTINLELAVFACKRRLSEAMNRFPDTAALHFIRAYASSMLGFNRSVVDDLARAVYFSRQSFFYLRAVLDMSWIEETRPALVQQCRLSMDGKHA